MSDLVGNPEDRFSHDEAHLDLSSNYQSNRNIALVSDLQLAHVSIDLNIKLILSHHMRKPDFGLCENKGADRLPRS